MQTFLAPQVDELSLADSPPRGERCAKRNPVAGTRIRSAVTSQPNPQCSSAIHRFLSCSTRDSSLSGSTLPGYAACKSLAEAEYLLEILGGVAAAFRA
jgi:hypothetical protein